MDLAGFERACAMNDPDVILRIDRHADGLAKNPVVRQRLRPKRIDFEARSHFTCGLYRNALLQYEAGYNKRGEHYQKGRTDVKITLHAVLLNGLRNDLLAAFYINKASTRLLDFKECVEYCRPQSNAEGNYSAAHLLCFKLCDGVVVDDVPNVYGPAANFAVFDVRLAPYGRVEHH